jgi:hypothetical protein
MQDLQLSAVRDTERAVKATRVICSESHKGGRFVAVLFAGLKIPASGRSQLNLEQATKELDKIRTDAEALPSSKALTASFGFII